MSLAPARKEVSSSPSTNAVVDPTNRQAQAADVERKLRFYGVIQAFRQGRLPSNAQIHETLAYFHSHSPVPTESLSREGQKLIQDVRDIIKTMDLMISEKNNDELIQNFAWHTRSIDSNGVFGAIKGDLKESAAGQEGMNREKVKQEGDKAVQHLRTLLTLVLTNSEVRKLLSDFSLIGRDLLSTGASKAAKQLSPSADQLRRVDDPAPEDQFITEGGRVAGPNETPVLAADLPGNQGKVRMHPKEDTQPILHRGGEQIPLGDRANEGRGAYHDVRQQGMGMAQEAVTGRQNPNVRDETRGMAREAMGRGQELAGQAQQRDQRVQEEGREWEEADDEDKEQKKGGMRAKMRQMRDNVKDTFNDRVPEDQRNKANENLESTKKFFAEEYFPEERRDQFIFRFKKVLIECQKHKDYQESMRWLLSFFEQYLSHARTSTAALGTETSAAAHPHHPKNNTDLSTAMLELRTILERFANGTSMDVVIAPMQKLAESARKDPELRAWFSDFDGYMRQVLLDPGYVLDAECDDEAKRLRESGKRFWSAGEEGSAMSDRQHQQGTSALGGVGHTGTLGAGVGGMGDPAAVGVAPGGVPVGTTGAVAGVGSGHGHGHGHGQMKEGRYRDEFDDVFRGVGGWFKAMGDDKLNQRFGNDWARLTKDLLFDNEGSLKFKPELWNDIRRVIVPELIQQVGYIPIPRIEYTDEQFDIVVENLTLQGRNLFPNIVAVEAHNFVKFSPYDAIRDDSHHKISFTLEQIQADMRDVAFYYHKKTGLPKMRDSGLADVLIGGNGLSAHITLVKTTKDKSSVFRVADVHAKVEGLKFSIRDSKHDLLYKTLRPLMMGLVKRQVAKAIEDGLRTALEYVDGQLVGVRDRMASAKDEQSEEGRAQVLQNLFARTKSPDSTVRSAKSTAHSAQDKSEVSAHGIGASTSSGSHFKVVADKKDSLLGDVGNPAGWVNRSADVDGKVGNNRGVAGDGSGREWGSQAFNVLPGSKSRN